MTEKRNSLARAALVLGLASIVLALIAFSVGAISGMIAAILGIVALCRKEDKVFSVVGIITGALSILVVLLFALAYSLL